MSCVKWVLYDEYVWELSGVRWVCVRWVLWDELWEMSFVWWVVRVELCEMSCCVSWVVWDELGEMSCVRWIMWAELCEMAQCLEDFRASRHRFQQWLDHGGDTPRLGVLLYMLFFTCHEHWTLFQNLMFNCFIVSIWCLVSACIFESNSSCKKLWFSSEKSRPWRTLLFSLM